MFLEMLFLVDLTLREYPITYQTTSIQLITLIEGNQSIGIIILCVVVHALDQLDPCVRLASTQRFSERT
jgi:hypothetical protein